ncbi:hypothetical protein vBVpaS1601_47 [Vibrio phage vB_VpaS_1601]|nr:hypothetical protein vBVpaP1601_47 [Vibrio phage vB_VpaP_1601]
MYTLAHYFRDALMFEFPDWFYGIQMKRYDEASASLVALEPWPHQKKDLNFLLRKERAGLFNDAGVGKTIPMQAFGIYMSAMGNKTVFAMPPKLLGQFAESLVNTYRGVDNHLDIFLLNEKQKEAEAIVQGWIDNPKSCPDIVIMSYEMFAFLQPIKASPAKVIKNSKTGAEYTRPAVKPKRHHPLKQVGFNCLVFDEAHKLKEPSSATHKRVWRWIGSSEGETQLVLATGTPVYNQLIDAYGIIRLLTPYIYGSKKAFERKHAIIDHQSDYRQIIGWQNEEELHHNLYIHGRRVTKEEVLKDLPPMIPYQHDIRLGTAHKELYKRLMTERVLELEEEFIDATNASKLRQVALQLISNPNKFSDTPIKNVMDDWLENMFEEIGIYQHKVIVFAYFKDTVAYLVNKYKHLNPAVINGAGGDSEEARIKFLRDPSCRVLFLNWRSGGAGLNLQISPYELFYEVPTVPGDLQQAIARSHRGGQTQGVHVHIPRVFSTVANKSLNQLLSKQLKNNEVVKDKHKLLAELLGK